jgi:hypothetical protein
MITRESVHVGDTWTQDARVTGVRIRLPTCLPAPIPPQALEEALHLKLGCKALEIQLLGDDRMHMEPRLPTYRITYVPSRRELSPETILEALTEIVEDAIRTRLSVLRAEVFFGAKE